MQLIRLFLSFSFFLFTGIAFSQAGTVSDQEVAAQGIFIEAQREKLLGNYEKAEPLLRELLKEDSGNAVALYELAQVLDKLEKREEAVQAAEKAVKFDDENVWYQLLLASLYEKQEESKKAASVYKNLVKANPNEEEFYYEQAYHLVKANEPSDAIAVYDALEGKIGKNPETAKRKHLLYLSMGETKKAEKELLSLVDTFPEDVNYQVLLAEFYEQSSQREKAKNVYKAILKIQPGHPKATVALQGMQKGTGALSRFIPIFESKEINIDLKIKQLIPIMKLSKQDEAVAQDALQLAEILTVTHPDEAKAYAAYADVLNMTGQTDKARINYEKTLTLDESVFMIWEQLLFIYASQKDYDKLVEYAENAIDLFPNQARFYFFNGLGLLELGNEQEAREYFNEALLIGSTDEALKQDIEKQLSKIKQ